MENKKLEQLKVEKVYISDKKKDGTPITDPFSGALAKKVALKFAGREGYYTSFPSSDKNDPIFQIREGQVVKVITWEKDGFKNFKLPSKMELIELEIEELKKRIEKIEESILVDYGEPVPEESEVIIDESGEIPF